MIDKGTLKCDKHNKPLSLNSSTRVVKKTVKINVGFKKADFTFGDTHPKESSFKIYCSHSLNETDLHALPTNILYVDPGMISGMTLNHDLFCKKAKQIGLIPKDYKCPESMYTTFKRCGLY